MESIRQVSATERHRFTWMIDVRTGAVRVVLTSYAHETKESPRHQTWHVQKVWSAYSGGRYLRAPQRLTEAEAWEQVHAEDERHVRAQLIGGITVVPWRDR